jgi:ammonia channel protein AmtB
VSTPAGGDPLKVDVNAQYVGVEWNYTYIILCSFIVWLIIPGIGLLYSGLARRKSALALLFQAFMVVAMYVEVFFEIHSFIVLTPNTQNNILGLLIDLCAGCKSIHWNS